MAETITENICAVKHSIEAAAKKAGRDAGDIALIAVSKNSGIMEIAEACRAGVTDFGENRVQELARKSQLADFQCRWHFIGRLQTNKAKDVLGRAVLIHSLDRLELAKEIERRAAEHRQSIDVLIQVNVSGEDTKAGLAPALVPAFVRQLEEMQHIKVRGLMSIAPYSENSEAARPSFSGLRELYDRLEADFPGSPNISMDYLSMGMSNDYEVAIEEGANIVRVGRAIFGTR